MSPSLPSTWSKLPSDSVSVWHARERCCTTDSHLAESIPFEALRVQILTQKYETGPAICTVINEQPWLYAY